jgi:putative membrane protein
MSGRSCWWRCSGRPLSISPTCCWAGAFVSAPFGVLGILGTALAIFLAFRNNTAFGRWGEASQAWTAITAASRTFARLIVTFTDAHAHTPQYNAGGGRIQAGDGATAILPGFNALRLQLRGQMDVNALAPYLAEGGSGCAAADGEQDGALLC